jgi:hypothetical protein
MISVIPNVADGDNDRLDQNNFEIRAREKKGADFVAEGKQANDQHQTKPRAERLSRRLADSVSVGWGTSFWIYEFTIYDL